jgi:hypothetical protein
MACASVSIQLADVDGMFVDVSSKKENGPHQPTILKNAKVHSKNFILMFKHLSSLLFERFALVILKLPADNDFIIVFVADLSVSGRGCTKSG